MSLTILSALSLSMHSYLTVHTRTLGAFGYDICYPSTAISPATGSAMGCYWC